MLEIPRCIQEGGPLYMGLEFMQKKTMAEKILEHLDKDDEVLEFGCGASTLFYSQVVKSWDAIEFDEKWLDGVKSKIPGNVKLHFAKQNIPFTEMPKEKDIENAKKKFNFSNGTFHTSKPYFVGACKDWPVIQYLRVKDYVDFPRKMKKKFDKIFIDSRAVVFCALTALDCLKKGGSVIVLNAFARSEYSRIFGYYRVVDSVMPPDGDVAILVPKEEKKEEKTAKKKLPPAPEVSLKLPKKKKARKKKA